MTTAMSGTETKEDMERCAIWDALFINGPRSVPLLAFATGLAEAVVRRLVKHEWFQLDDGTVSIATVRCNGDRF